MESAAVLNEGLLLTGIGMGVVFSFLAVLVLVTGWMSKCINHYAPAEAVVSSPVAQSTAKPRDDKLIAIVAAAIHQHRSRGNRVD